MPWRWLSAIFNTAPGMSVWLLSRFDVAKRLAYCATRTKADADTGHSYPSGSACVALDEDTVFAVNAAR